MATSVLEDIIDMWILWVLVKYHYAKCVRYVTDKQGQRGKALSSVNRFNGDKYLLFTDYVWNKVSCVKSRNESLHGRKKP